MKVIVVDLSLGSPLTFTTNTSDCKVSLVKLTSTSVVLKSCTIIGAICLGVYVNPSLLKLST